MFTIRFIRHESKDEYRSYACRSYEVVHNTGLARVIMSFPDGELLQEQVGQESDFGIAYVTNLDSRTIDVIRAEA